MCSARQVHHCTIPPDTCRSGVIPWGAVWHSVRLFCVVCSLAARSIEGTSLDREKYIQDLGGDVDIFTQIMLQDLLVLATFSPLRGVLDAVGIYEFKIAR